MFKTQTANFTCLGLARFLFQIAAISNRGFWPLYFKARATRFLITHPLSITKPVSGFSKSVHALGSGHLFLLRRDNTIWNRVLFGIGRAFLEKAALVDLRGYGAPHPHLFVVARDDVDLRAGQRNLSIHSRAICAALVRP